MKGPSYRSARGGAGRERGGGSTVAWRAPTGEVGSADSRSLGPASPFVEGRGPLKATVSSFGRRDRNITTRLIALSLMAIDSFRAQYELPVLDPRPSYIRPPKRKTTSSQFCVVMACPGQKGGQPIPVKLANSQLSSASALQPLPLGIFYDARRMCRSYGSSRLCGTEKGGGRLFEKTTAARDGVRMGKAAPKVTMVRSDGWISLMDGFDLVRWEWSCPQQALAMEEGKANEFDDL